MGTVLGISVCSGESDNPEKSNQGREKNLEARSNGTRTVCCLGGETARKKSFAKIFGACRVEKKLEWCAAAPEWGQEAQATGTDCQLRRKQL